MGCNAAATQFGGLRTGKYTGNALQLGFGAFVGQTVRPVPRVDQFLLKTSFLNSPIIPLHFHGQFVDSGVVSRNAEKTIYGTWLVA